jgi:hypothetical protein
MVGLTFHSIHFSGGARTLTFHPHPRPAGSSPGIFDKFKKHTRSDITSLNPEMTMSMHSFEIVDGKRDLLLYAPYITLPALARKHNPTRPTQSRRERKTFHPMTMASSSNGTKQSSTTTASPPTEKMNDSAKKRT